MNTSLKMTSARRLAASVVALAGLCLTSACGSDTAPAPAPTPAPSSASSAAQPAATGDALRENFTAAAKSAPWAEKVSEIKLDGRAVIVTTSLTKAEKATSKAVCEAALQAAKDTKTDFQSVAVRSTDDATLAHQNEMAGPKQCEN